MDGWCVHHTRVDVAATQKAAARGKNEKIERVKTNLLGLSVNDFPSLLKQARCMAQQGHDSKRVHKAGFLHRQTLSWKTITPFQQKEKRVLASIYI